MLFEWVERVWWIQVGGELDPCLEVRQPHFVPSPLLFQSSSFSFLLPALSQYICLPNVNFSFFSPWKVPTWLVKRLKTGMCVCACACVCVCFNVDKQTASIWGQKQDLNFCHVSVPLRPISNLHWHLQSNDLMTLMAKGLTISSENGRKY